MTNLKEVAKLAGVSVMTVSRVVNNKKNVSQKTKEKVEKALKELDYEPNLIARSLVKNKSNIIGIADYSNEIGSFFDRFIAGTRHGAEKEEFDVLAFSHSEEGYGKKIINSGLVDGIILMGYDMTLKNPQFIEDIKLFEKNKFPYVLFGRRNIDFTTYFVAPDYINGMKKAVEHLIENGHKRIGYIGSLLDFKPDNDKFVGFKKGLSQNNVRYRSELVSNDNKTQEESFTATKEILKKDPTAIIVDDINNSIGALSAINESSFEIPEDISFIGWRSEEYSDFYSYYKNLISLKISHLRLQKHKLGKKAAQLLISQIEGHEIKEKGKFVPLKFDKGESISRIE